MKKFILYLSIALSSLFLSHDSRPPKTEVAAVEKYNDIRGELFGNVALVPSHEGAYYYWKRGEFEGLTGKGNTLVLVDSHSDDGRWNIHYNANDFIEPHMGLEERMIIIKGYVENRLVPRKNNKPVCFMPLNSASYIWPAVEYDKLIDEVYWIVPMIDGDYMKRLLKDNIVAFGDVKIPFNVRKIEYLEDIRDKNVLLTVDLDYWYLGDLLNEDSRHIKPAIGEKVPCFFHVLKEKTGKPKGYITIAETKDLSDLNEDDLEYLKKTVLECLRDWN
ncbi:MAG: hypothetical protein QMD85_00330 [Candidatus Aenigmarchaeota archaeon]|nr:hypothetical protein [Candidatus Aenigmarchaeota archaeon]MDI6721963.1 hypothetical protein [Candidatus Aenigmarchaeota archaeon]